MKVVRFGGFDAAPQGGVGGLIRTAGVFVARMRFILEVELPRSVRVPVCKHAFKYLPVQELVGRQYDQDLRLHAGIIP